MAQLALGPALVVKQLANSSWVRGMNISRVL